MNVKASDKRASRSTYTEIKRVAENACMAGRTVVVGLACGNVTGHCEDDHDGRSENELEVHS